MKTETTWRSRRLDALGSAIFAEIAEWKAEALREGKDVIDLGIGSPDRPPAEVIREALGARCCGPTVMVIRLPGEALHSVERQQSGWTGVLASSYVRNRKSSL